MGFPSNWFIQLSDASEGLSEQYSNKTTIPSQVKHQAESEQDISQDEQLPQDKQRSPSPESSISIPCLVKQPNQDEVKGVIKEDLGDRFLVDISDELISISKLFVYPDFSKSVGQIEKNPSKISTPSKKRKKGYGTGYIECKPIKRSGKKYQQYWYHYEEWREGDRLSKKSKYIPSRMRSQIEKMNSEKAPVEEILKVLSNRSKRK